MNDPLLITWSVRPFEVSGGEICVANFIPPANGASQGNYIGSNKMLLFWPSAPELSATFLTIKNFNNIHFPTDVQKFFQPILFSQSSDNWGQSLTQTDRKILWHLKRVYADFFFQLNLLPPYLLCSQGDNKLQSTFKVVTWIKKQKVFVVNFPVCVLNNTGSKLRTTNLKPLSLIKWFKIWRK